MVFKNVFSAVLRISVLALCVPVLAFAQSAQDRRLVETSEFEAGFEASVLAFSGDEASLYISGNGETGQIIRLDLGGVEQISQSFEGVVSDLVVGPRAIFVIGTNEEETWVEMRDLISLDLRARQTLPLIGIPKGHLGNSGTLYVAGYTPGSRDNASMFAVDGAQSDLPVLDDQHMNLLFNGAIGSFWVSEDEGRIFVNDAEAARLWSITTEGRLETSIGHNATSKEDAIAFSVDVSVKNDPRCEGVLAHLPDQPSRFIMSDYILGSVSNAVYSFDFGVFDVVSDTASRLRNLEGTELETFYGSTTVRPPMLVSASCDQSTILIASTYSDQVVQFAHQVGSNAFELVFKESIRTGRAASAVATSDQGNWGAIALKETGTVVILGRGQDVQKEAAPDAELLNRAIQRHLLLVGYRSGAIDGILGGRTIAAMEAFKQKHGLEASAGEPDLFLTEMMDVIEAKGLE